MPDAPLLVPELDVSDLDQSLSVYIGVLGFTCHVTRPEESFAYLVREGGVALVGQIGGWMTLAGLVWLLLTAVFAPPLWFTGIAVGVLGLGMIRIDPGRLPMTAGPQEGSREKWRA